MAWLPSGAARNVSYGFSFPWNRNGARAVGAELRRRRFDHVWVGEESTGDDYWHVWAWHTIGLDERTLGTDLRLMTHLARTHGGTFTGWSIVQARGIVKRHS